MADKPIKVAVLEGDFAALSLLGFPLEVAIQLQQNNLNLDDALWTAKSSVTSLSVFLWPAQVTGSKTKRKRRKSKQAKANALSTSSHKEAISKPASKVSR